MKKKILFFVRSLFNVPKVYLAEKQNANVYLHETSLHTDSNPKKLYKHTTDRKTFKSF
jgi:hypothetical protein